MGTLYSPRSDFFTVLRPIYRIIKPGDLIGEQVDGHVEGAQFTLLSVTLYQEISHVWRSVQFRGDVLVLLEVCLAVS